jgi:hypothetical protein
VPGGVRVGVAGAGGGAHVDAVVRKNRRARAFARDTIGSRRSGRPRWSARADGCRAVRAGC